MGLTLSNGRLGLAGRYFDRLRKVDGEWKFAHRRFEAEYGDPDRKYSTDDFRE